METNNLRRNCIIEYQEKLVVVQIITRNNIHVYELTEVSVDDKYALSIPIWYMIPKAEIIPAKLTDDIIIDICKLKKLSMLNSCQTFSFIGSRLLVKKKNYYTITGLMDIVKIKYLHQLQNIYFDFTNKELIK